MSDRKGHNAYHDGTVEHSRQIYHEIGLCYTCGRKFDQCTCEAPEWKEISLDEQNAQAERDAEADRKDEINYARQGF